MMQIYFFLTKNTTLNISCFDFYRTSKVPTYCVRPSCSSISSLMTMFGNLYHENMRGVRQSQEVKLIPAEYMSAISF